jgi:DNA-binding NarL/FixJ family response regulator
MRVLLAENSVPVRRALRLLLNQQTEMAVVGEATNAVDLLYCLEASQPDVLLLDWRLPGMPGEVLLPILLQYYPDLTVVVMSVRPEDCQAALAAGAGCFVSKANPPDRFLDALACVDQGPGTSQQERRPLSQSAGHPVQLDPT